MPLCRKIGRSWYTVVVGVLVSIIALLRHDLAQNRHTLATRGAHAVYNSSIFDGYVARRDVKAVLSQLGDYMIYPNVRTPGQKPEKKNDITLLTHASYYNLRYLPDLVRYWQGPVSIAVFTSTPTKVLVFIELLCRCSPLVDRLVRWHVVVPFSDRLSVHYHPAIPGEADILAALEHFRSDQQRAKMICHNIGALLQSLADKETNYETYDNLPYPNNMLRNVAWEHSRSKYVLNIDIDLVPSEELRNSLLTFFATTSNGKSEVNHVEKTAYVLPVFEMKTQAYTNDKPNFPISKPDLQAYFQKQVVRQFYTDACPECQNCTDYKTWFNLKVAGTEINNIADMEYTLVPPCEPFVVLPRTAPKFDERFVQYGYNRISQVCEVYTAGFEFKILDNAFLIHIGFKENDAGFHTAKLQENAANEARFNAFRQELRKKYEGSDTFC